ncbi:hypothetical protein [Arsukibacterium sp.]|uniref:hypothetical protein n=1 Tax=Arsukibacterium sp. TaxID=1977258 RepID=UPI002FD8A076
MLSQRAINDRAKRGITGADLYKPLNPGNHKIDQAKAESIWADLQALAVLPKGIINVLKVLADKHQVPLSVVKHIKYGRTWNHVTGLAKRIYE